MIEAPDIPGASNVVSWFGYWPILHDSEVLSITLDRRTQSQVLIQGFERTSEVDERGYYVRVKHAFITFSFEDFPANEEGVTNTYIDFFNHQNVLFRVSVEKQPNGYLLTLDGIFGIYASIFCKHLSVKIEPVTETEHP